MDDKKQIFKNEEERLAYFSDPNSRQKLTKKKQLTKKVKLLIAGSILLFLLTAITLYTIYIISGLPSLQDLENPKFSLATHIYSSDGENLDQLCYQNRTIIPIDSIPKEMINALIATEDIRFYDHWGVDVFRFIKARLKNFPFKMREGASTITQQLARKLYLTDEVTITRKLREWLTAVQIERTYTKDEILSLYLNVMYMGRGAYGVETAAQAYFDKPVSQLTLSESAFIIGILKGPENYEPEENYQKAIGRRNLVLSQMLKRNFITEDTYSKTVRDTILTIKQGAGTGIAPHFVEMIRQQLQREPKLRGYDIYRDGLRIHTSIDFRMQEWANKAVDEHIDIIQKEFNPQFKWAGHEQLLNESLKRSALSSKEYLDATNEHERKKIYSKLINNQKFIDSIKKVLTTIQVGFVVIDPLTGQIKAMVGGAKNKKFKYGLNHVTQIRRQPGSSFKPFTYITAIDSGFSPATTLENERVEISDGTGKIWSPGNSDGKYGGWLTLREGLRNSVNIIAARIISELVTPQMVVSYAHRLGITSEVPPLYSIALGTIEVSPLEMTSAFGTIAAEGIHASPIAILRVEDRNGKLIYQNNSYKRDAISKATTYIMTNMMEEVVNGGTATTGVRKFYSYPAAGKTGTTQQMADAWFVGFTKQLVAGVWVGFDDRRIRFTSMTYGQGGRAAAPIWGRFMKYIYSDPRIRELHPYPFAMPDGVERALICVESGKLAANTCLHTIEDLVLSDKKPPKCDGNHKSNYVPQDEKPAIGF